RTRRTRRRAGSDGGRDALCRTRQSARPGPGSDEIHVRRIVSAIRIAVRLRSAQVRRGHEEGGIGAADPLIGVDASAARTPMRTHPHLYEISAWPWLERLSAQGGRRITLANVPAAAWDALADAGVDYIYLMGVWRRSGVGRLIARTNTNLLGEYDGVLPGWSMRDVTGSPYSIQAYEPDDRMGGWAGLDST